MLNEDELAIYFSKLPHDLNVKVNNKLYSVNKDLASMLSGAIRALIQENPNSAEIQLDFNDSNNIFYLVINFLQATQIPITPQNAYDLQIAAETLDIPSLQNALKIELEAETNQNNIIPRIIHNREKPDFLFNCIEEVKNNEELFDLPVEILIEITKSEKTQFASISNRYLFSLICCSKFPDHFSEFLSENELLQIPLDVLETFIHDERYQIVKDKFPIQQIAFNFVSQIGRIKSKINEATFSIASLNEEIENAQNEKQNILIELDKVQLKLEMYQKESSELQQHVLQFRLEDLSDIVFALKPKIANEDILNQYAMQLNQIDQINKKDSYYIQKMGNQTIFIYHETRANAMKWLKQLNEQLTNIHTTCAKLPKNDAVMVQFLSMLSSIIKQIQLLFCDSL